MRIGCLADPPDGVIGGAELASRALQAEAPPGCELVPCPPGAIAPGDAYVVAAAIACRWTY